MILITLFSGTKKSLEKGLEKFYLNYTMFTSRSPYKQKEMSRAHKFKEKEGAYFICFATVFCWARTLYSCQ
jgi:membrane protein DedA with SNARE-associated domain